jgi:hypothetical protein
MIPKSIILLLLLLGFNTLVLAQQDSVYVKKGVIAKWRTALKKQKVSLRKTDTLKNKTLVFADSLTIPKVETADTLKTFTVKVQDSVSTTVTTLRMEEKSLGDSLEQAQGTIIESINKEATGLESQLREKPDSLINHVDQKFSDFQNKVDTKAEAINNELESVLKTDLDIPEASVPQVPTLPEVPDLDKKLSTDNLKLPEAVGLEDLAKVSEKLVLPDLAGMKEMNVPEGFDQLKKASQEMDKVDGALAKAEEYETDLINLKDGNGDDVKNLPDQAEKKVLEVDEVKFLDENAKKLASQKAKHEALLQRYQDKKLLQEEIKRKKENVANDLLNKNSAAFKEAQANIAKAQKLNPVVQSFKDMPAKRTNEIKDKPFYERLIPGISLQAYNTSAFSMDFSPHLGYRLTERWSVGLGVVYRAGFNERYSSFVRSEGIYGFRNYISFKAIKGFYLHGEFETLRLAERVKPPAETNFQQNVYASHFGVGKQYPISRKINGTLLALYRIEYDGHLPGMSKINLRVGFNYVTKKSRKPTALR